MTLTTYKWNIKEWHKLVESGMLEGKPVEFLNGEIIEMSPEGVPHRYTNHSVVEYLRSRLRNKAVVFEAHPVTLDNSPHSRASEPEPDIAIASLPEVKYKTHHPYAEDIYWLIEISNKTLKIDREQKARIYASNNIAEYWIIDLVNNKLVVHTKPEGNIYTQIDEFTRQKSGIHQKGDRDVDDAVYSLSFPSIKIELNKLLLY